jgi:predicted transcriptional regulator
MADSTSNKAPDEQLLHMTATVVAAYVRKNSVPAGRLGDVIDAVYASLRTLDGNMDGRQAPQKPAVPVKKSVMPEYLICLEDGKKLKMLKRHLRTNYKLTPEAYRQKWGLPADYPMVAPNYAHARSVFAKRIGLGRGGRPRPRRGGRRKAAAG